MKSEGPHARARASRPVPTGSLGGKDEVGQPVKQEDEMGALGASRR